MNLKKSPIGIALLVPSLVAMTGCVVERPARVRGTVYVEATPPPPPPPSETVVIEMAPPPPREEIIVVRPSADHVWVRGYWAWRDHRHIWVAGRWVRPPRRNAVWVEPRWEHREHGYVFIEGRWR
jgi:hypothetical protein